MARSRLDLEMTRRGLAESRESAQRLIMAGRVRVNSRPANKPDLRVERETEIVALVKPQFEVGKGKVGRGGVVRDEALRRAALDRIIEFARECGLASAGTIESPIKGPAGNVEYLIWLRRGPVGAR